MKMSVGDRLVLLSVLPAEGDFTTLKILRKLREELSFSDEEHKLYKFEQLTVDGQTRVKWDNAVEQERDINFGEKATDIIVVSLKKLNDAKKLRDEHFGLYEKFIGEK